MAEDLVSLGSVHGSVSGTCAPPRWPGLRVSVLPRWWPGAPSPAASSLTRLLPRGLASDGRGCPCFSLQHRRLSPRCVQPSAVRHTREGLFWGGLSSLSGPDTLLHPRELPLLVLLFKCKRWLPLSQHRGCSLLSGTGHEAVYVCFASKLNEC